MDTPDLAQRLDRLERENHCWKVLGTAGLAILALIVLMGAAEKKAPEEIRARKFTLVDDQGRPRAVLSVGTRGPLLNLGINLEEGATLAVLDGMPVLMLNRGASHAGLVLSKDGAALGLSLGSAYAGLEVFEKTKKTPMLTLSDAAGKTRLLLHGGEMPSLNFRDKDGNMQADFTILDGRMPAISLRGGGPGGRKKPEDGMNLWVDPTLGPAMRLTHKRGQTGPFIMVEDGEGRIIWRAP